MFRFICKLLATIIFAIFLCGSVAQASSPSPTPQPHPTSNLQDCYIPQTPPAGGGLDDQDSVAQPRTETPQSSTPPPPSTEAVCVQSDRVRDIAQEPSPTPSELVTETPPPIEEAEPSLKEEDVAAIKVIVAAILSTLVLGALAIRGRRHR